MDFLDVYLLILVLVLGLCVGSFLNVVIFRLPRDMSLIRPASHCPNCNYKLKWYDNIPVLSYILLKGKCRNCGKPISPRYMIVEITNMVLWLICLLCFTDIVIKSNTNDYIFFIASCLTSSCLLAIFFCDKETMIIPNELLIVILISGLIATFSDYISTSSAVFGFLVGGGVFLLIYIISYAIKKRECMGQGDIKLVAVLGLVLGLPNTILMIVLASLIGCVVLLVVSKIKKEGKNKEYPFAVFIAPAAILVLFVGNYIVNWYLSLFIL